MDAAWFGKVTKDNLTIHSKYQENLLVSRIPTLFASEFGMDLDVG
jgi:hypothetical protein